MAQLEIWGKTLEVRLEKYFDGGNRIQCYLPGGEPYCTATYNTGSLKENEVAIKDYSPNEGILDALCEAGAVTKTGVDIPVGFESLTLCILNRGWFDD